MYLHSGLPVPYMYVDCKSLIASLIRDCSLSGAVDPSENVWNVISNLGVEFSRLSFAYFGAEYTVALVSAPKLIVLTKDMKNMNPAGKALIFV